MTIEKNLNGSITVSTMKLGYRVSHTYLGYTVKECLSLFRQHLRRIS